MVFPPFNGIICYLPIAFMNKLAGELCTSSGHHFPPFYEWPWNPESIVNCNEDISNK